MAIKLKYSWFQLTFGQEETYLYPEKSYERLKRLGYDAIELTPPKGRYGLGVSLEQFVSTHKKLLANFDFQVSCINECWGEEWDPYSPHFKTMTERKTADLAIRETKEDIDIATELGAPFVTVATAIHTDITRENVKQCTIIVVDTLRQISNYAKTKNVKIVFEATNHLEMGKYVNTALNHKRLIKLTGRDNIGIQLDWFHASFEELNPYEAVMDAHPYLWHMHFRDSNSLVPGYGTVDFKAVLRAIKKTNYSGFCTLESAPLVPDAERAAKDGIDYLKICERIADYQISSEYPDGYEIEL